MPSCRRCTHCTARACTPSLPQDLLQAPHSSATQLPGRGKRDTAKALEAMPALGSGRAAPNTAPDTRTEGMRAPRAGRGGLTPAGSTPGGYSAAGSASASCHCRRSFCAPSGCRFSAGSRTWCTGCLEGQSTGSEAMGAGVPPARRPVPLLHPCRDACSRMSPLRWDPSGASPSLAEDARVGAGPPSLLGSRRLPWGAHTERGEADSAFPPLPPPSCSPKNPGQNIRVSWWRHSHHSPTSV